MHFHPKVTLAFKPLYIAELVQAKKLISAQGGCPHLHICQPP